MFGPPEYYGPDDPPSEEVIAGATRLRECEYWGDLTVPLSLEDEEVVEATEY